MGWAEDQRTIRLLELILQKQQQTLTAISQINVSSIQSSIESLKIALTGDSTLLSNAISKLQTQVNGLVLSQTSLAEAISSLSTADSLGFTTVENDLGQILHVLIPPPAVTCVGIITLDQLIGENNMAKSARATGDLAVADNGTLTGTLSFQDSLGETTSTPAGLSTTFTSSDSTPGPSIFTLVSPGPSGDGATFSGSVNPTSVAALVAAGTALPTGLTISFTATWTGLATPISGTFTPALDVVAGPAATAVAVVSEP